MVEQNEHIHPVFDCILDRQDHEKRMKQKSRVFWLYGLSGSGKSTLAGALERRLFEKGFLARVLDGDNIRTGLNSNLGFSDEDRAENIRRIAEVSKLFVDTGIITVNSFITPKKEHRNQARSIVGESDFFEIYIKCSFDACEQRDVKGLYAKAKSGKISNFTGRDSEFETPDHADLVIDTDKLSEQESLDLLYDFVLPEIRLEDVAGR